MRGAPWLAALQRFGAGVDASGGGVAPAKAPNGERRAGAGVAAGDDAPHRKAICTPAGGVVGRWSIVKGYAACLVPKLPVAA